MKRKEKEKEEQLALASALSRIVMTRADIFEMGREVVFELKQLMPLNWVTIGLIEESKNLLHLFTLLPKTSTDPGPGESIPLDDTPVDWLVKNKKALLEPDLLVESRFWTGDYWLNKGLRTIVYMPLFSGGKVFGGLIFASTRPRTYGDRELKLLRYATSQLASPIRYSRLFAHIIEGKQDTVAEDWMTRTEQTLRELTDAISEYALHLKSHTAAIQGLSEASQELKNSAAEQNRVLADLANAITRTPPVKEPVTTGEQEPPPLPVKDSYPPGCYNKQRKPARAETLVEKQRKLLEKRGAIKRPVRGSQPYDKDVIRTPSRPPRYRRQLPPPL
ncbi:MAG TPA: GAF domain-containing protein [Dehalococcoidia bacterium]|nr:GAF domain-containing protein [Dehalococcoidia bacterium]